MPSLIPSTVPPGRLRRSAQPSIGVSDELSLRPWSPADAPAVVEAFEDPTIQRWHGRHAASEDEAREWIAGWGEEWERETAAHWAIVRTGNREVLGRISLRDLDLFFGQAECAYWILPGARGSGVVGRAVTAVAGWAFGEAGFHRLEIMHSVANTASCRVAAKAGFAWEGTKRSAGPHADGWHDMHLHARITSDERR
ncbi:GNAT family N-acetyltransferase [Streptomyces stramineus]